MLRFAAARMLPASGAIAALAVGSAGGLAACGTRGEASIRRAKPPAAIGPLFMLVMPSTFEAAKPHLRSVLRAKLSKN